LENGEISGGINKMDPIATLIDLNGKWESNGLQGPIISVSGNAISVDMSAYQRPPAHGAILDASDITVTFPDDQTYTAKLKLPNTILWSNASAWTKVTAPITTIFDLNGRWASGKVPGPVLTVSGNSIRVDMRAYHRPSAHGTILDAANITITFPDDQTYAARLQTLPDAIVFSNNSFWTKVVPPAAPSALHLVSVTAATAVPSESVITVGWTDNSDNEAGFTVWCVGGGASEEIPCGPNITNASTQRPNGRDYVFSVVAFNSVGRSMISNTLQVTVPATPFRFITVEKQGTPASTSVVVKGTGFTPGSLVVIRVTPQNFQNPRQFATTADGGGSFTATSSFPCVAGILLTFTAFEDANPTGTIANAVSLTC
jgi:hypothetical protein